jgi:guanylate kinase
MADAELISFPIVVSGASGVGKTTLCHGLMEKVSRLAFSISATTREARHMEKDGRDYFFISVDEFERMRAAGELAEWARVHGQSYGTPKKWLDGQLAGGTSILLDIDVQGGVQIMEAYPDAVSIFIVPPSWQEIEKRLRGRKSDSEEAIDQRLKNAIEEMEYIVKYGYVVTNDTVDAAVARMEHIVRAERMKRARVLKNITWRDYIGLEAKGDDIAERQDR